MKETIELFSGTKSFSKVAKKYGYKIYTIDNDCTLNPDLCIDINDFYIRDEPYDILWASPPCQTFSVASCYKHWHPNKTPKTMECLTGLRILEKAISIIGINKPNIWFIENPRGLMRKVIDPLFLKYGITDYTRHTVTYCQYGDTRMKPTDIWTNSKKWIPRPACKNGDKCHESAPRGSRTGTQGLKNAKEKGVIPEELFEEIFVMEK